MRRASGECRLGGHGEVVINWRPRILDFLEFLDSGPSDPWAIRDLGKGRLITFEAGRMESGDEVPHSHKTMLNKAQSATSFMASYLSMAS